MQWQLSSDLQGGPAQHGAERDNSVHQEKEALGKMAAWRSAPKADDCTARRGASSGMGVSPN